MNTATRSDFDAWLAYYSQRFSTISDDALQGYWYLYGRGSEGPCTAREGAAYAAVNYEMANRA